MELMRRVDPDEERQELEFEPGGRWWTGRLNRIAIPLDGFAPPSRIIVVDATLREGEETAGVVLSEADKMAIATASARVGLSEMEVGYAGAIPEHRELVRSLKASGIPAKLASHTRVYTRGDEWRREIDQNVEAGADILTLVGFASEGLVTTTPWIKKSEIPERVAACVRYAKGAGVMVTFGLADAVRTKLDLLVACYRAAVEAGVDRLYVYDGLGAAAPEAIRFLTVLLRGLGGSRTQIGVHCHDGLGLATANALAAVRAGATVVDAVPLGLGDSAGISALEEVVFALEVLYGVRTQLRLEEIHKLCRLVSELFRIPIPPNKALVGGNIYRHSIDSHIAAILRGCWYSWELIRPEVLGQERRLEFGFSKIREGRSGAVAAKLAQMGVNLSDEQLEEVLLRARQLARDQGSLGEEDLERVILQVAGNQLT